MSSRWQTRRRIVQGLAWGAALFSFGPCAELSQRAVINGLFDAINARVAAVLGEPSQIP